MSWIGRWAYTATLSVALIVGAKAVRADCHLSDVSEAASSETSARKMEISVWIADADAKLDEKALARAFANLSTTGVLFDVQLIHSGSSDQAQKQFRSFQGDAFIVLDAQMMSGKSPKYNTSLSAFKDQDLADQSIIIDPMDGLDVKQPRFVQIDGGVSPDIAAYRIEATIGLIEFSKLWGSQAYKQYALSTGQANLTPQLQDARHAIMDECILPAWKPR